MIGHDDAQVICPLEAFSARAQATMAWLEDELGWYERAVGRVRLWFRGPKLAALVVAAAQPVVGVEGPAVVTGCSVPGVVLGSADIVPVP